MTLGIMGKMELDRSLGVAPTPTGAVTAAGTDGVVDRLFILNAIVLYIITR